MPPEEATAAAIRIQGLTKTFQRKQERGLRRWFAPKARETITAVDHVDLDIQEGELFGLLGPNGAGKTTLVKLLSTLLLPTEGTATISGLDVAKDADQVRRRIGVVLGGERALYWRLTARENLWYFSQLYDLPRRVAEPRIDALLERVGLTDRADERVENYSKGMKQRLHIARGLLNDPSILLLDEPTIGLDPHAARDLRTLVRELADQGTTLVLTTHYMQEADDLSDRVAIMNHGRIVACDTPTALKARHADTSTYDVLVRPNDATDVRDVLLGTPGVTGIVHAAPDETRAATRYRLLTTEEDADEVPGELAQRLRGHGATLLGLQRDEVTLEDVFVRLTGETLTGAAASEAPTSPPAGDGAAADTEDAAPSTGPGGEA